MFTGDANRQLRPSFRTNSNLGAHYAAPHILPNLRGRDTEGAQLVRLGPVTATVREIGRGAGAAPRTQIAASIRQILAAEKVHDELLDHHLKAGLRESIHAGQQKYVHHKLHKTNHEWSGEDARSRNLSNGTHEI